MKKLRVNIVRNLVELNEKIVFNRRITSFYKRSFKGSLNTIIDVGANEGQSIDLFLKINPNATIYAFEPNPKLFSRLVDKYSNNVNVKLFKLGVSDLNGKKVFNENVLHSTSSLEELNPDSQYLSKKATVLGVKKEELIVAQYEIEVVTLDKFLKEHNIQKVDLIKIDTEGHEYSCLKGLFDRDIKTQIDLIQLEQHNDDMYKNSKDFTEITELLNSNRFKILKSVKHGFGDFEEIIFQKQKY